MHPLPWLAQCPDSPLRETYRRIQMVAPTNLPVLLQGETGSGKEVAAQTLHRLSLRSKAPFIAVNCGALSPTLLESTLFGAVRGAYTGSHRETRGLVRAAHGGTLFLDEIGELPMDAQSRLLRVLQEHRVVPVGGDREIPVDFRLVCATHRDLRLAVQGRTFREDLYFRIHVFPIRLAPLRERVRDIMPLAREIWNELRPQGPALDALLGDDGMGVLCAFPWPGNVRQLRNTLERYSVMGLHGGAIQELLEEEPGLLVADPQIPYRTYNHSPPWDVVCKALEAENFNRTRTARRLGISRGSLCYQLQKRMPRTDILSQNDGCL